MRILAPAKLNLYLDVTGKRDDGYHRIESVMQSVGIFDTLDITVTEPSGKASVEVYCHEREELNGENNIIYKAAIDFFKKAGISAYDVRFSLDKRIPSQAGLGGGSADAAAALYALNLLFSAGLSAEALSETGAGVGADVPFCLKKGTCVARGNGDLLESCTPMPDCLIVVAVPENQRISTADAYNELDRLGLVGGSGKDISGITAALDKCDLSAMADKMYNIFENALPSGSSVPSLINSMLSYGASAARMSGSGPAVYGLFSDIAPAKRAKEELSDICASFICRPVRRDYKFVL